MPQSTTPPAMPAVLQDTPGILPPTMPPMKQSTKVVQPIMTQLASSGTSMNAKEMPTASASRLVAMAITSSCECLSCV